MNAQLTELAFILDRSGSMAVVQHETIAGFNRFLEDQQSLPGEARLSLVMFDTEMQKPLVSVPVASVAPLDTTTYTLGGSTALLDAIGETIDELGARLAAMPEAERPAKVIVAILTDGEENASRRYSHAKIDAMIRHQRDVYSWEFLFLGANQDAIATAASLGIAANNAATFVCEPDSVLAMHASISRKAMAMRKVATHTATKQDLADFAAPTSEILAEETEKRRKR